MLSFIRTQPISIFSKAITNFTNSTSKRTFTFTFAGPKNLDELLKKESIVDKTGNEVTDIWYTYHEEKVRFTQLFKNMRDV